ncbi:hypothetical protein [Pseudomonas sp. TH15]|uniref:hypothetical protein n=1 Tax=Pseudomonas sp. TH15 TaxID=2796381 RepID=UPI0019141FBA|nr:hypothetical protein [Pseudomonas sp. TH15]MBK5512568.1 hypothetical protein [Pseudomonas sp. TH15]
MRLAYSGFHDSKDARHARGFIQGFKFMAFQSHNQASQRKNARWSDQCFCSHAGANSPNIIGEIDAMWAHAEQFFPSFPDWIMEHDEKALAANALVFWAVELVHTDKKYAAVLLSAAGFCVYDVDQAKFTNDPRFNLMMRGAATVAQGKGLDFYSNLLETDEPF